MAVTVGVARSSVWMRAAVRTVMSVDAAAGAAVCGAASGEAAWAAMAGPARIRANAARRRIGCSGNRESGDYADAWGCGQRCARDVVVGARLAGDTDTIGMADGVGDFRHVASPARRAPTRSRPVCTRRD